MIRKKKEKLIQQSMRKEKLRKVGFCFITGCFIKPFKMIINILFFFISQAHSQRNFGFLISGISKRETGNWGGTIFLWLALSVWLMSWYVFSTARSLFTGRLRIVLVFLILTIAPFISEYSRYYGNPPKVLGYLCIKN